ncbi:MAG: bacillithiol biosynthesis cysteine-adding enzyme BshC [Acidobacteria bacterium]|nr:bacillithiol biosynthesis cysteine-adding enzyme BshC [Acidobacteriota bacterium]MCW5948771.1 bacillithiol biosynthesis cysteine-adding enzyme BshC [Pyrinomonadaceae bacterium]
MNNDTACRPKVENGQNTAEFVRFDDVGGQARLFLDHLAGVDAIRGFYADVPRDIEGLGSFAPEVLASYTADRASVCDALEKLNKNIGNDAAALQSVDRLRSPGTVAVLTGQQAGFLGGPLYTIYKALSAIRLADSLTAAGVEAVPIFWAATEDHDLDEVAVAHLTDADGTPFDVRFVPAIELPEASVGELVVGPDTGPVIRQALGRCRPSESADAILDAALAAYEPGERFGTAFCRLLASYFRGTGLIFADPMEPGLKAASRDLIAEAIRNAAEINGAVRARDAELAALGYLPQVLVDEGHLPLFLRTEAGQRSALRKSGPDTFKLRATGATINGAELLRIADAEAERLSAGALLRPVVQDQIFPTVCYVGGAAEIAYFAQSSAVYDTLGRPRTPIIHRRSVTVLAARHRRAMSRYELKFSDVLKGRKHVLDKVGETLITGETDEAFEAARAAVELRLDELQRVVEAADTTLLRNLERRRARILYHLDALREKTKRALVRRSDDAERRLTALMNEAFPFDALQERSISSTEMLAELGLGFIEELSQRLDPFESRHLVFYP